MSAKSKRKKKSWNFLKTVHKRMYDVSDVGMLPYCLFVYIVHITYYYLLMYKV